MKALDLPNGRPLVNEWSHQRLVEVEAQVNTEVERLRTQLSIAEVWLRDIREELSRRDGA